MICTGKPYFVSREMGDMLKDRGLDNLTVVDTSKINNFALNKCINFDSILLYVLEFVVIRQLCPWNTITSYFKFPGAKIFCV